MLLALTLLASLQADGPSPVAIIPQPVRVVQGRGGFEVTPGTVIWVTRGTEGLGRQLADYLHPAMGYRLEVRRGTAVGNRIILRLDSTLRRLGPEGYRLEVEPGRIAIRAPQPAGVFYGIQSLRQLLPPAIYRAAPSAAGPWVIPAVQIEDYPRFPWRGAHLDVSRHFMPRDFVRKYIDLLALHKLNRFHWHLTDDQGWRIEIRKYPRLTEVGAWRRHTLVGPYVEDSALRVFDNVRHGGYYTQEDIREIVAYAAERFITIVPEIEMPGHAQAAITAYPWLGNTDRQLEVLAWWGVSENILNPGDSVIGFMQDVLTEVMELFPGSFIHVGGDEAVKTQWKASPQVQARIRELGLRDEHELQSWFIRQMDRFLTGHGRRLIGWDEILEGGLAENAAVMSWRGTAGGITAARAGHDVVMAPTSHTYLDYYQSKDTAGEPLAIGGFLPLDTVYAFEPMPAELEPAYRGHILGAQAQVWTEYLKTPRMVEYMAFPRLSALSEVVWTPGDQKDYARFLANLQQHLARLEALDVNFRAVRR